jgi:uncharacterized membrane protein YphA (DoxX/SURF4 family)
MLNPFPIQFLAPLAYTVLRVVVGTVLFSLGLSHLRDRDSLAPLFSFSWFPYGRFAVWYLALIELAVGLMFLFGFLTQIAALLAMFLSLKFIVMRSRWSAPSIPDRLFYILLFGASFTLFVTGAGAFAFDLPI